MNVTMTTLDDLCSRYIRAADRQVDNVVFPLPRSWWSRPYEYAWAMTQASADHVSLDAGCGVSHPFKFWLGARCREAHACDTDARLIQPAALLKEIAADFGHGAAASLTLETLKAVRGRLADLTDLAYENNAFDRIFCISVLKHVPREARRAVFAEFYRTLRPGGRAVLTFDVPSVRPEELLDAIRGAGFVFAGELQPSMPDDAIFSDTHGERQYVFRMLLEKPS
ncbi:class I SAM-dependent methyltransferase [Paenibacillus thermoaerophilus]|uniref:Class I SAM-dependent methyltransferase n=1 Tax=Paenibacillus thermoaerophilus TaxID=1215385 RepID=A0ABW2V1Y7_9BACL|nr:class I SAM-dependent methyltransferase [Paenibacillus thermoaerophilus]